MGWRNDQCKKVCWMIDDFLANRPTERDSLIVAVQKAFDALEKQNTGRWIPVPRCDGDTQPNLKCPFSGNEIGWWDLGRYCAGCGAKLEGGAE